MKLLWKLQKSTQMEGIFISTPQALSKDLTKQSRYCRSSLGYSNLWWIGIVLKYQVKKPECNSSKLPYFYSSLQARDSAHLLKVKSPSAGFPQPSSICLLTLTSCHSILMHVSSLPWHHKLLEARYVSGSHCHHLPLPDTSFDTE